MATMKEIHDAVGTCPMCGKQAFLNHVPLTAYCFGTEDNPHRGISRLVPKPQQPHKYSGNRKHTVWKKLPSYLWPTNI
jgi:hypothetical protein